MLDKGMNFREWLEATIADKGVYWVSPSGEILSCSDTHIAAVIQNPEKFSLTREQLIAMHERYGEKLGQEGKARQEILIGLMEQGWIRIRKYNRPDFWTVQTEDFGNSFASRMKRWMHELTAGCRNCIYDDLVISNTKGESKKTSIMDYMRAVAAA